MSKILNNISTNDITKYNSQEIIEAFDYINSETKNLSKKTRKIILGIIELTNKFKLDKKSPNLKEDLLYQLLSSNDIKDIGIGKIIIEILNKGKKDPTFYPCNIDYKTGLPNEKQFISDINNIKGNKTIVILKVNNFKHINSVFGYKGGDSILNMIKNKILELFGKLGFKVYRISQVNFGLLKEEKTEENKNTNTFLEINKLIQNFSINSNYGELNIKISGGISEGKNASFDNTIKALYFSSTIKNNKFVLYNENIKGKIKKQSLDILKWGKIIKEGIEKGYFIPYYQGIRNNQTGLIDKYESLIRYDNGKETYSPFYFLEIAEKLNYLGKLTEIMIEKSISEMKYHDKSISINLTEDDFTNNNLIKKILKTLQKYSINPDRLIIEVLEDITTENNNILVKNIERLKKGGVKISIDDFGTGKSNFARLISIKPDFLKIDGNLIKGIIGENQIKNIEILKTIVTFGHKNGAKVIAEYVENKEIQNIVEMIGIDYSQGYLYSKPSRDLTKK